MTPIPLLQNSSPAFPHFSRWTHLDVLIDSEEMGLLFDSLGDFSILSLTQLPQKHPPFVVDKQDFLSVYQSYIHDLKNKKEPPFETFRSWFHMHWTKTLEGIAIMELPSTFQKLYVPIPTLQTKPICLQVSEIDHLIRVSSLRPNELLWGLRFSFPGLYQAPNSHTIDTLNPSNNVNAALYKQLRAWLRKETFQPFFKAPYQLASNLYLRVGNQCRAWIHNHNVKDRVIEFL